MFFGNVNQNYEYIFKALKLPVIYDGKVLGAIIDNKLKFEPHITYHICIKSQSRN